MYSLRPEGTLLASVSLIRCLCAFGPELECKNHPLNPHGVPSRRGWYRGSFSQRRSCPRRSTASTRCSRCYMAFLTCRQRYNQQVALCSDDGQPGNSPFVLVAKPFVSMHAHLVSGSRMMLRITNLMGFVSFLPIAWSAECFRGASDTRHERKAHAPSLEKEAAE